MKPHASPVLHETNFLLGELDFSTGSVGTVTQLGELLWIMDMNRQWLDRVVPDLQIHRLTGMFEAAGWQVITLKWGRTITELFGRPGGTELRARLEEMPNEEYQRLLRADTSQLRSRIAGQDPSPSSRHFWGRSCSTPSRVVYAISAVMTSLSFWTPVKTWTRTGRPSSLPSRSRPRAADRGTPEQPLGVADGGADADARRRQRHGTEPALARVPRRCSTAAELCGARRAALARTEVRHATPMPVPTALSLLSPCWTGIPNTLAFLAGARGDPTRCLGVTEFGESSALDDAYARRRIDASPILNTALTLVGR